METIDTLSSRFGDVFVGAGTVLDAGTARAVQLAGAEFLVTPTVDTDVIEVSNRYGTPIATKSRLTDLPLKKRQRRLRSAKTGRETRRTGAARTRKMTHSEQHKRTIRSCLPSRTIDRTETTKQKIETETLIAGVRFQISRRLYPIRDRITTRWPHSSSETESDSGCTCQFVSDDRRDERHVNGR
ncbi:hypothetical protein [Haloterrigena turkmenica]|uniref:hypothetical protein n=1 Tax=Haloterrigena turkmenica TaxID=62320 RepID=UPI000B2CE206